MYPAFLNFSSAVLSWAIETYGKKKQRNAILQKAFIIKIVSKNVEGSERFEIKNSRG